MKFHHVALSIADVDRTLEFYGHFGLTKTLDMTTDDGQLRIIQLSDDAYRIELFWSPAMKPTPVTDEFAGEINRTGLKHVGFWSDNLDADLPALAKVGIKPCTEVMQARSMSTRYLFFRDPDGHWVELMGK